MTINCARCEWPAVEAMRDAYRAEMGCQVLRDAFHRRPGWVEWYLLTVAGEVAGYGAVAVVGTWNEVRSLFEVDLDNVGSIKAMVRAGMVPCAYRVIAKIK